MRADVLGSTVGWPPQRACDNLREYAEKAVLPRMDPSTARPQYHRRANNLSIKHEDRRQLEYVQIIPKPQFFSSVTRFCSTHLPNINCGFDDVDHENGGGITIDAPDFEPCAALAAVGKGSNTVQVFQWVMRYPLWTVNHMIHLAFNPTESYTLQEGEEFVDGDIFRWAIWARDDESIMDSEDVYNADSVMIMVQPPWVLAEEDLRSFAQLGTFDHRDGRRKPMTSSERLWGKVWDLCYQKRAHWFVLTSYEFWMPEWTYASVSPIMADYKSEPTTVQCLFFWFSSAVAKLVGREDTWPLPVVGNLFSYPAASAWTQP
ncbi:hypothetical protein GY45DRAFT_1394053 [Cubamyces sp. BRFM 1775]|nr:hypothetical protein GY45DRAFT_1394053 [Cubamyces sp. BRFM 1775]